MENRQYPSLNAVQCSNCGSKNYRIIGTKGSMGKAIGSAMFGAIGALAASSNAKNDYELRPLQCKCKDCKAKFDAMPSAAAEDDILDTPCTITLRRLSSFVGMAVVQQVFLNGIKVGNVKNNSELTFETNTKNNVIFVTDQSGVAFCDPYVFTAQNGEVRTIDFKRKFV